MCLRLLDFQWIHDDHHHQRFSILKFRRENFFFWLTVVFGTLCMCVCVCLPNVAQKSVWCFFFSSSVGSFVWWLCVRVLYIEKKNVSVILCLGIYTLRTFHTLENSFCVLFRCSIIRIMFQQQSLSLVPPPPPLPP